MRDHRIVALVVLIVAAALLVGYLIGRAPRGDAPVAAAQAASQAVTAPSMTPTAATRKKVASTASTASPAKKSSAEPAAPTLNDLYADLKRRADANDADAATELYRDLRRCQMQREYARSLPSWAGSELDHDSSNDSEEQRKMHDRFLESMQKEIDFVQRNAAFCENTDTETLNQMVPASLKAAQLGDLKALRCYVGGELSFSPGLLDHPEWLGDFKQNALPLADYGFKHGDWGVVGLYGHAYGGFFSGSMFGQALGKTDPVQAYQYLKLQQLGASGDFLKKVSGQAQTAATDLTQDQIAQADGWAQDMYARYFNGTSSNELGNGVNTCGGYDED